MTFVPKLNLPETDDAIRKYESRKLTYEGWFWPVARQNMRHGPTIRARMVEDLQIISMERYPDQAALQAKGWTMFQIIDHADRALDAFFHVTK